MERCMVLTYKRIDPPSNPSCQMEFPIGDTDMEILAPPFRYGGYRVSVDGLAPSDSSTPTLTFSM